VPVTTAASTAALIVGTSPCPLWELDAHERLRRQLAQVGSRQIAEDLSSLGDAQQVLVIDAGFLFDLLTLRGLIAHPGALLVHPASGRVAAASVARDGLDAVVACVRDGSARPTGMRLLTPAELAGYDRNLRKTSPPLLEPVTLDRRAELEALLYGNAYKGITDFVTKWWWPRPARAVVGWCARFGISPNMVTLLGFLLVLAATFAFYHGAYALGLEEDGDLAAEAEIRRARPDVASDHRLASAGVPAVDLQDPVLELEPRQLLRQRRLVVA